MLKELQDLKGSMFWWHLANVTKGEIFLNILCVWQLYYFLDLICTGILGDFF